MRSMQLQFLLFATVMAATVAAAPASDAPGAKKETPAASTVPAAIAAPAKAPLKSKPPEPGDLKTVPPGSRVEIVPDERGRAVQKVIEQTATEKQIDGVSDAIVLARMAQQFEQQQDWRHQAYALERLFLLRPMQGPIGYELAAAYARKGDKRATYDVLVRLQGTGYGFAPGRDARFEKVKGTPVWDYILLNLEANLAPFGGGRPGFTLPKGDTLFDSIGYDPVRKRFLVASVRDGSIQLADEKGKLTPYISANGENGLLATFSLAVDAPRDLLWVIGNGVPHRKGIVAADYGRAVLYKFTLSTGKFIAKYETPAAHRPSLLSSIAVSPKGDVYVADGVARRIYRVETTGLQMVIENPRLTSIRGMTFNALGTKLYFADYDLGLFGIDLNTGKAFALQPSKGVTLYGIDGVSWWNGYLVVVQNGFPPARVMRLTLDPAGTSLVHGQALDASKPEFGVPTSGVVAGDGFWFIANSQRNAYDAYGVPKDEDNLAAVRVYRSDLKFAIDSGKDKPPVVPAAIPPGTIKN